MLYFGAAALEIKRNIKRSSHQRLWSSQFCFALNYQGKTDYFSKFLYAVWSNSLSLGSIRVQQSTPKSIPYFCSGESGAYLRCCRSWCCKSLLTVIRVELAHWYRSWHLSMGPLHIFTALVPNSSEGSVSLDRITFSCEKGREEHGEVVHVDV